MCAIAVYELAVWYVYMYGYDGAPRVQWVAVFSLCEYALYLRAIEGRALQEQIASHVQLRLVKALGLVLMQ